MYFECNIPRNCPDHVEPSSAGFYEERVRAIYGRMEKLEAALELTGLEPAAFARTAAILFRDSYRRFEEMPAETLSYIVVTLDDGTLPDPRMDWPNVTVLVDTAFLTREEWELIRCTSLGGSEAAVVLGVSPYQTKRELYYKKICLPECLPGKDNSVVFERGHILEDRVVEAFCNLTGAVIIPETRMFASKTHPHCSANVDAFLKFADGRIYVFEGKTTIEENFAAWTNDKIPGQYVPQMRQYPAVMDDPRIKGTYIGCLFTHDYDLGGVYLGSTFDKHEFVARTLDRDLESEAGLLEEQERFWAEYVAQGQEPPADGDPDKEIDVLKRYSGYADPAAPVLELFRSDHEELAQQYLELDQQRRELDAQSKRLKDQQKQLSLGFIEALGTHVEGRIMLDGDEYVEVKYSPRAKATADLVQLEQQYPEAYASCVTHNPQSTRVFTLKRKVERKKK